MQLGGSFCFSIGTIRKADRNNDVLVFGPVPRRLHAPDTADPSFESNPPKGRMNTLRNSRALLAAVLILVAAPAGFSQTFDVSFLDGSVSAFGSVDVVAGIATSGSITVAGDPFLSAAYALVSPVPASGSVRDSLGGGGDDMIFDNVVNSTENHLTTNGLGFAIGYDSMGHVQAFANLWENSPGSYDLYVAGNIGNGYGYNVYSGSGSITAIPEASTYAAMIGAATLVFTAAWRRRQAA